MPSIKNKSNTSRKDVQTCLLIKKCFALGFIPKRKLCKYVHSELKWFTLKFTHMEEIWCSYLPAASETSFQQRSYFIIPNPLREKEKQNFLGCYLRQMTGMFVSISTNEPTVHNNLVCQPVGNALGDSNKLFISTDFQQRRIP